MKKQLLLIFSLCLSIVPICRAQITPTLFGLTSTGAVYGSGNIFQTNTTGTEYKNDFPFFDMAANPPDNFIQASNGLLYATEPLGGANGGGEIFSYNTSTGITTDVYDFPASNITKGFEPFGSLVQTSNGLLYGLTNGGGIYGAGTIYSFDITSGIETDLYDFGNGTDGAYPQQCSLIQASDGLLYGMTYLGGANDTSNGGDGIIFSYDISTGIETKLHDFGGGTDGQSPDGALLQASNGLLYGVTYGGGANSVGTIFSFDISLGTETDVYDFNDTSGANGIGTLIQAKNGLLYGLTQGFGTFVSGTIFTYDISTTKEKDVYDFMSPFHGIQLCGSLIQASNGLFYGLSTWGGTIGLGLGTIFSFDASSGTVVNLHNFGSGYDGQLPMSSLLQANDGLLYGMTQYGGCADYGIIFNYNISTATENILYNFGMLNNGGSPMGSLILANNSLLYGLTTSGGIYNLGALFSYNSSTGKESVLHSFGSGYMPDNLSDTSIITDSSYHDGYYPMGTLLQANNGVLYGMTTYGGANDSLGLGDGVIFSYNYLTGSYTKLYNFGATPTDGIFPTGAFIQAKNGLLYGTTENGGLYGNGTLFSYDITTGTKTSLFDFGNGTDGKLPGETLLQANNGLLYGVTYLGGVYDSGMIFSYDISSAIETDLHDFGSGTDGIKPVSSLIQASNDLLYGTTTAGGTNYKGTLFSYNISTGIETDIHDFGNATDGTSPNGSLLQASDGLLYGMNTGADITDSGIVFSYDITTGTLTNIHSFYPPDGGSAYGSLIEIDISGINKLSSPNYHLSLYPNPASNQLTVISNQLSINSIEITNVIGQVVLHTTPSPLIKGEGSIDVSSLPDGLYFVTVTTYTGVVTDKIIINK